MARMPLSCPVSYAGRYTINPGDTMYEIASLFRISLNELIRANPHISNPNIIFPGDVLCVPGQVSFPCCATLEPLQPSEIGEAGVAMVYTSFAGNPAVSVMAVINTMPSGFDLLMAEVDIPNVERFRHQLYPTPQTPPTYSGTIFFPTAASLTPDSIVRVFPVNSTTGNAGQTIMAGSLTHCLG